MDMKKTLAVALSSLFISASFLMGSDEGSMFDDFQRLVQASEPRAMQETVKDDHSGSSAAQQRERFERKVTDAALAVLDRAAEFEKSYPRSLRLRQVHDAVKEATSMAFGYMGLPIPAARVADVEARTRDLLRADGKDDGLHMVLFRIAENSPLDEQRKRLKELSLEVTAAEPSVALSGGKGSPPMSGEACTQVKTALKNLERVGSPMELSFFTVNGQSISLAALKGKVVTIDFWAPSCGPCVRDFPHLKELYNKYKAQGLEVLGISTDPDEKDLKSYLQKHPLPWPVKYDGNESTNRVAEAFGIKEIPVVWLIDRHGVLRDLRGREGQDQKIEALLKEQ